ncbi:Tn7-like element transposition protein TnsE [Shewanella subflava]|uniref:Tn7-like element transposition protein TnsE n=1 Tax=Shewanella subflava TaxID=2986476 RepID=A0ABT3IB71_9GAMM|nr:Tn7-like element transposition protein TnsE [Shewanella subflava]MCW3173123.1 Tn7-like element transposition protein TnsE [Shewanella subflava]
MPDLAKSVAENLLNTFSEWISKNFPALNYLPENVELKRVNGVFRSKNLFKNKQIYIGVEWQDGKLSSLPIEVANFVAPGRTFSGKEISYESQCERITVTILGSEVVDKSLAHYRYCYQTDNGLISISGFELARTLFFHNRHLVHAAYSPNGLEELAFVGLTSSPIKIRFPESTSYPVSYLNTRRARAHLAWLLLDHEARRSFFSIYQSFQQNTGSIAFNFTPPDLEGWKLELSIIRSYQTNELEVQRIESIVDAQISESFSGVEILHPKRKFQAESADKEKGKLGRTPDVDIDPDLDMGNIPAFGKRLHTQKASRFSFNVSGIQGAVLSDGKESPKSTMSAGNEKAVHEQAGVGSPEWGGDSQEFDPVINQDDAFEGADVLPQKFIIFEQVVNELGRDKRIILESVKCGVFPNPTNKSRVIFQTKDQQTLRFFVAIIEMRQTKIVVLEADTASLAKSKGGSTLMLGLKDDANTNFKEIIQHFSDSSAQWRHQYIRERTNCFVSCHHPRLKEKGRVLSEDEYKSKWVNRLREKLNETLEQKR